MEDNKAKEGLEQSVREIENTTQDVVTEVDGESAIGPTVDDVKSAVEEAAVAPVADKAEESHVNQPANGVNEPANDDTKTPNQTDQTRAAADDAASSQPGKPSKRVQEGQAWNNRNRERVDYKKNIKSDVTTQDESSDPVAIRKQVDSPSHCRSLIPTNRTIPGRILLFRFQSTRRQIPLLKGRGPNKPSCPDQHRSFLQAHAPLSALDRHR